MLRYGNMVVEYGFVGFVIMLVLHILCVCSSFLCIELCFVLCAYHVHDKMSLRYFCVSLWIPLSTKMVGIIMFLDFETSNDFILFFYFFLTLPALVCTLLHMMRARAHTRTFFDMLSE